MNKYVLQSGSIEINIIIHVCICQSLLLLPALTLKYVAAMIQSQEQTMVLLRRHAWGGGGIPGSGLLPPQIKRSRLIPGSTIVYTLLKIHLSLDTYNTLSSGITPLILIYHVTTKTMHTFSAE